MTKIKQEIRSEAKIVAENTNTRVVLYLHGPVDAERYAREERVAHHRLAQLTPVPLRPERVYFERLPLAYGKEM